MAQTLCRWAATGFGRMGSERHRFRIEAVIGILAVMWMDVSPPLLALCSALHWAMFAEYHADISSFQQN